MPVIRKWPGILPGMDMFLWYRTFGAGAFELKKTLGFISGMRYNAKSTAKHAYVAFANYDAQLGLFAVEVPKEPGRIDFTSPNGSTIKGTFNVKIEKDLWMN